MSIRRAVTTVLFVFALAFSMAAPLAGTADACPPTNPTGICWSALPAPPDPGASAPTGPNRAPEPDRPDRHRPGLGPV